MLVLSRKLQESITLPDSGVTITVLRISGERIQLGIEAPKEVSILREELRDKAEVEAATTAEPHGRWRRLVN
ncbi:MAG TPA: carbon storage regulator [Planctomycetaceae bacterium]|nr:carbon storage regulator [Planctomycetaceae bacterium]